jgi:hypothetical protein
MVRVSLAAVFSPYDLVDWIRVSGSGVTGNIASVWDNFFLKSFFSENLDSCCHENREVYMRRKIKGYARFRV